jgi:hypothetical protein
MLVFNVTFSNPTVSLATTGVMIVSLTIPSAVRGSIEKLAVCPTLFTTNSSSGVAPVLVITTAPKVNWYVPAFAIVKSRVVLLYVMFPDGELINAVNGT